MRILIFCLLVSLAGRAWAAPSVVLSVVPTEGFNLRILGIKGRIIRAVPIQDPDGVAVSRFNNLTENWDDPKTNSRLKEVLAYSAYFRDMADTSQTLDIAISLHNVEANEAPNFSTPFAQSYFRETTIEFNRGLFEQLKASGYTVANPAPNGKGVMSTRLYGWLALHLGALNLAFEVNDRDPENRLSIEGLQHIGGIFAGQIGAWMTSDAGDKRHAAAQLALEQRAEARQKYLAVGSKNFSDEEKQFALLMKGF